MLKFATGNAKLCNDTLIFDIPAGYTCPAASNCLAFANKKTGKIKDGKNAQIRCYAASQEAVYANLRKLRWENFNLLKGKSFEEMVELIEYSILKHKKSFTKKVRIHSSGDFFSRDYFLAWNEVARRNKNLVFYCYTKSIHFVKGTILAKNFKITYSLGGKFDHLIEKQDKTAQIVFSKDEAKENNLKIDTTDALAYTGKKSFALLLHNTQKKGSKAAKAWQKIKTTVGGYSRK